MPQPAGRAGGREDLYSGETAGGREDLYSGETAGGREALYSGEGGRQGGFVQRGGREAGRICTVGRLHGRPGAQRANTEDFISPGECITLHTAAIRSGVPMDGAKAIKMHHRGLQLMLRNCSDA